MSARVLATALKPGQVINYRNGSKCTVRGVTIRNGFSGPLAVVVDHDRGREIYAPTARLTITA